MSTNEAQSVPAREKYWEEKSTEERLLTLSEYVARLFEECQGLRKHLDALEKHQHGHDGTVLVPLQIQGPEFFDRPYRGYRTRLGLKE